MSLDEVIHIILVCGVYWMTIYQVYVGVLVKLSWGGDWLLIDVWCLIWWNLSEPNTIQQSANTQEVGDMMVWPLETYIYWNGLLIFSVTTLRYQYSSWILTNAPLW